MYSILLNDRVIVKDENAHNLYNKRYYGNLTDSGLELSFIEALFLLTKNKIEIYEHVLDYIYWICAIELAGVIPSSGQV